MGNTLKIIAGALLLAMGAVVSVQAASTEVGDWTVTCDEENVCFAQMTASGPRVILGRDRENNTLRIGVIVTAKAKEDQPVTLRLDNNTLIYLKVNGCTPNYCEAMVRPQDMQHIITRMHGAQSGFVSFLETTPIAVEAGRLPRESVALQLAPLSFKGFADALSMVMNSGAEGMSLQ